MIRYQVWDYTLSPGYRNKARTLLTFILIIRLLFPNDSFISGNDKCSEVLHKQVFQNLFCSQLDARMHLYSVKPFPEVPRLRFQRSDAILLI